MRAASEQTVSEELTQHVAELTARVAELTRRLDLIEVVRGNGKAHPHPEPTLLGADDSSNPIEFLTDNGFVIVRPWEEDGSPAPTDGNCRFVVSDPNGNERTIAVRISRELMTATAIHTSGRIDQSSEFWICCAEKRLADYVAHHDGFPEANEITVSELDREDLLLTIRWGKSG
jgi:hypothetical protein